MGEGIMNEPKTVRSAHPVSDEMRATVLGVLARVEREHDVRILLACESGSRGWGFASPGSDYDVRFLYVQRLRWHLTVEPGRDVVEEPISGELDVGGWGLRKALGLLRDSNPTLLEWLRSPIVYRQDDAWVARLRTLAEDKFSPVRGYHHYVSMARKNLREHLRGESVRYKKYLYVLRPLLAARWIREGRGVPPMRFADLVAATSLDAALVAEIDALLEVKMRAGEAATSPRRVGIHDFIERELAVAEVHAFGRQARAPTQPLDDFLHDAVRHFDARP